MSYKLLAFAAFVAACGPTASSTGDGGGSDVVGGMCAPGTSRCDGTRRLTCSDGRWQVAEQCANVCDDELGCVLCQPGTGTCSGNMSRMCRDDGMGYVDVYCDPLQGLTCDFEIGVCTGDCAPQNLGRNYIGCDYYPTVTGNEVDSAFEFAVAVSNTTSAVANVHIEGGALTAPRTLTVAPGDVAVERLPWVPQLKACNNEPGGQIECGSPQNLSALVAGGAYHLRSDRPVTVYQFNPLDYKLPGSGCRDGTAVAGCSYTNDASLLLPVNAMTGNYYVASYPAWPTRTGTLFPSFLTVTGTADGTQVTIAPSAATVAGGGLPAFQAGVAQTITLNAGDVAQLFSTAGDLTGSLVRADKPVQVVSGHYCTEIPHGTTACDHIEESMIPYEALGNRYLVTPPAVPPLPNGKVRVVRIIATEPNTTLQYDPPQGALATTLASAGDFTEVAGTVDSFLITASAKVLVVQYLEGQEAAGNIGDPAMAVAVPIGQYRTDYQFHAPQNYTSNYVDIVAPMGANVTLDGVAVTGFSPIGATGYGVVRQLLSPKPSGNYTITGDQPFGISVYGYGSWTSYFYPGGLDLSPIVVE